MQVERDGGEGEDLEVTDEPSDTRNSIPDPDVGDVREPSSDATSPDTDEPDGADTGGDACRASESCNGVDDDCDGMTDEKLTQLCPDQMGVCKGKAVECTGGSFPTCEAEDYGSNYESGDESRCDGLDNDCDGNTDEQIRRSCGSGPSVCNSCKGVCSRAEAVCNSSGGWTCSKPNAHEATEQSCQDGKDNDCDGKSSCRDSDCTGETCGGPGTACAAASNECQETACNDGTDNDQDGLVDCADGDCRTSPKCEHRIFVTSALFRPGKTYPTNSSSPYRFNSISEADTACNTAAKGAGLSGNWRAILSDASVHAKDHISVNGPIHNLNDEKVADDRSDLWSSSQNSASLDHAVQYDETGTARTTIAWTATETTGEWDGVNETGSDDCRDWSSGRNSDQGEVGNSSRTDLFWIVQAGPTGGNRKCGKLAALYCIDGQ